MKQYICILIIAFSYQATCFPVGEPSTSIIPEAPSITPEIKGADQQKSDLPVPSVASVIPEKPLVPESPTPPKELASNVSPSPIPPVAAEKTISKDIPVQDIPKQLPAVAEEAIKHVVEESTNKVNKESAIKPTIEAKSDTQTSIKTPTEQLENQKNVEQVAVSSEKPKEANSQVNSVLVEEPKPVRNIVKLDILQEEKGKEEVKVKEELKSEKVGDEIKIENVKDEVKSEKVAEEVKNEKTKVEEVKSNKVEAAKSEVVASDEVKHSETPVVSKENVKGDVSSEEKNMSGEHIVSEEVRKESEEKTVLTESKHESGESKESTASLKPTEKLPEEPKKEEKMEEKKEERPDGKKEEKKEKDEKKDLREESPVKPIVELQQVVESGKLSTVAASPILPAVVPTATEKVVDQERDYIKREATNHKHEDKKSTEVVKKDKLKSGSSPQKDEEIKSSKGQDKIVN